MRSDDAVNSVESHAEYEESTAQSRCPEYRCDCRTEPHLTWREIDPMDTVQVQHQSYEIEFFFNFWRTWVLLVGATDTPVLIPRLLWVSKPEWAALFKLGRGVCVTCSLRFTSGVTPTNLMVASITAEPSLPHTCEALAGLEPGSYHAATHSMRSGRPDALSTELSRWNRNLTTVWEIIMMKY